jgi:hypothetical protein
MEGASVDVFTEIIGRGLSFPDLVALGTLSRALRALATAAWGRRRRTPAQVHVSPMLLEVLSAWGPLVSELELVRGATEENVDLVLRCIRSCPRLELLSCRKQCHVARASVRVMQRFVGAQQLLLKAKAFLEAGSYARAGAAICDAQLIVDPKFDRGREPGDAKAPALVVDMLASLAQLARVCEARVGASPLLNQPPAGETTERIVCGTLFPEFCVLGCDNDARGRALAVLVRLGK